MTRATSVQIVLITTPDLETAQKLADLLLSNHLAACVNLVPGVQSHYWWQGQKEQANEILCICKTTTIQMEKLKQLVMAHHPYETPEIIAIPVIDGLPMYLRWIEENTQSKQP